MHRIVFIIWDDIMGDRCRLSAATEESPACTNSHAIKEPTYTQMYKHRHIANVFFSFFFIHLISVLHHLILYSGASFFSSGLVTILFKGIKALRLEINLMFPSSGHGSDQSTLKNRTRILRGPPIKDDE